MFLILSSLKKRQGDDTRVSLNKCLLDNSVQLGRQDKQWRGQRAHELRQILCQLGPSFIKVPCVSLTYYVFKKICGSRFKCKL